jgi:hypothetical protein
MASLSCPFKLFLSGLLLCTTTVSAQWLDWLNDTENRLELVTVANSDDEEKDVFAGDLNNDGWPDMVVVRKEPFSLPSEPPKSDLLLINQLGVMVDQTELYAPEFISNPTFARDVYIEDFDSDGWLDVIVANTFSQQPIFYKNLGNDINGNWLGLADETASRFPLLNEDNILFCAVWGGDVTGDGHKDIYFVNYRVNGGGGTAKDYLLINNGAGVFTNESQARLGNLRNSAFGTAVQLHDMDNDGDLDIIKVSTLYSVSPWNDMGTLLLFNDGNGNFVNWQNLTPSAAPYMFEVADFNLDGNNDLYIVDDSQDYTIIVNSYTANTSLSYTKNILPYSSTSGFGGNVHAADLDLDGDMDIGVSDVDVDIPPCVSGRRFALFRNDGGTFSNPYGNIAYEWATNSYDFAFIDINQDGLLDFISGKCSGYGLFMSDNCDLAPNAADYDGDGLADACDPCPTNPSPNCEPDVNFPVVSTDYNIARQWNELLLASIRKDFARPTIHARNLFHTSLAMWDAWAAYDENACTYLLGQTLNGFSCEFNGVPAPENIQAARDTAITYASYRILYHRFANSPNAALLRSGYDNHMQTLGMDKNYISTDYANGSAAALGNYIAACVISYGLQDGSNEQNSYANTSYAPVNPAMIVDLPGNPNIQDLNRWQPLTLDLFIDQSGNAIPGATPGFLSPEWGQVLPFALSQDDMVVNNRGGFDYKVYHDPGQPPLWSEDGSGDTDLYRWTFVTTALWSGQLDATDGVMWDISPASLGNRNVLPETFADHPSFYDQLNGGTVNNGHPVNPATGLPYAPNIVPRADYARVLAEFWADGPESETPPGHWFTIFNHVSDHPLANKQYKGTGPVLDDMEWDVKGYFTLGGAMHDVAVTTWGIKGWYDYLRPISAIRAMADLGQCSDALAPSFHPGGLPLIPGYIELVALGDPLAGDADEHVNKIKIRAWKGHKAIDNVDTDEAGVDWILAESWEPYQRPSFVTPPFAGYVSGHSSYSRAAAEVLTMMTGDPYFPGGMSEFVAPQDEFLVFEDGPSVEIHLQWATYRDAADESALSRIWGGIHPPADDIPSRKIGIVVGTNAFNTAESYFTDSDSDGLCDFYDPAVECPGDFNGDGQRDISDLLIFLTDYGCTGPDCIGDTNNDELTNTNDLIGGFLPFYSVPCD